MDFLSIHNTDIGYKKALVNNISANAKLSDVVLLMGNNGVGKTTLIKSLLKQIPILKGEIIINGTPIKSFNQESLAKKIAIVFSKSEIPTNYTVLDLISFGKYIHYPYYFKLKKEDIDDVNQIIRRLNLEDYKDSQLAHLSDGNLQKAFIGRALAQNSPFIILDEPTTHLDEENKLMILKLLRDLAKDDQKLIIFSSHDWRLAKEFSDQIWWIKNGEMQSGLAENILLNNKDLIQSHLLAFHPNFVPPTIVAPQFQKELLYSFLQKNFENNLSEFQISFLDDSWTLKLRDSQFITKDFLNIKNYIIDSINKEF